MKTNHKTVNCERCGHLWFPRKDTVKVCPKCKSPYFDIPRKEDKKVVLPDD